MEQLNIVVNTNMSIGWFRFDEMERNKLYLKNQFVSSIISKTQIPSIEQGRLFEYVVAYNLDAFIFSTICYESLTSLLGNLSSELLDYFSNDNGIDLIKVDNKHVTLYQCKYYSSKVPLSKLLTFIAASILFKKHLKEDYTLSVVYCSNQECTNSVINMKRLNDILTKYHHDAITRHDVIEFLNYMDKLIVTDEDNLSGIRLYSTMIKFIDDALMSYRYKDSPNILGKVKEFVIKYQTSNWLDKLKVLKTFYDWTRHLYHNHDAQSVTVAGIMTNAKIKVSNLAIRWKIRGYGVRAIVLREYDKLERALQESLNKLTNLDTFDITCNIQLLEEFKSYITVLYARINKDNPIFDSSTMSHPKELIEKYRSGTNGVNIATIITIFISILILIVTICMSIHIVTCLQLRKNATSTDST